MSLYGTLWYFVWWHYSYGLKELARAWGNIHWFLYHFFSIPILIRTFIAPFHRLEERHVRGFNPEHFLMVIVVNTMMRIVGMLVRAIFLGIGAVVQIGALLGGMVVMVAALLLPLLIPVLIVKGIFQMM